MLVIAMILRREKKMLKRKRHNLKAQVLIMQQQQMRMNGDLGAASMGLPNLRVARTYGFGFRIYLDFKAFKHYSDDGILRILYRK